MKVNMICHCGDYYRTTEANLKRGWGYSCSKHCAAVRRDFGRPKAKRADGRNTKQVKAKPSTYRPNDNRSEERDPDLYEHPQSCEGLGQWTD